VGSLVAGYLSDQYILARKRSGGTWLPEDRLRATLPGIAIFAPLSVVGYGLTTTYIRGMSGVWGDVFWLFLNGIGVSLSFKLGCEGLMNSPTQRLRGLYGHRTSTVWISSSIEVLRPLLLLGLIFFCNSEMSD